MEDINRAVKNLRTSVEELLTAMTEGVHSEDPDNFETDLLDTLYLFQEVDSHLSKTGEIPRIWRGE